MSLSCRYHGDLVQSTVHSGVHSIPQSGFYTLPLLGTFMCNLHNGNHVLSRNTTVTVNEYYKTVCLNLWDIVNCYKYGLTMSLCSITCEIQIQNHTMNLHYIRKAKEQTSIIKYIYAMLMQKQKPQRGRKWTRQQGNIKCRPTLSFAFKSNPQDLTKYSTMDNSPF